MSLLSRAFEYVHFDFHKEYRKNLAEAERDVDDQLEYLDLDGLNKTEKYDALVLYTRNETMKRVLMVETVGKIDPVFFAANRENYEERVNSGNFDLGNDDFNEDYVLYKVE
jgi:hypothetical protein